MLIKVDAATGEQVDRLTAFINSEENEINWDELVRDKPNAFPKFGHVGFVRATLMAIRPVSIKKIDVNTSSSVKTVFRVTIEILDEYFFEVETNKRVHRVVPAFFEARVREELRYFDHSRTLWQKPKEKK